MTILKNTKGSSLVTLLVAGAMGAISATAFMAYGNYQANILRTTNRKLLAEGHATELLEMFRGMTRDEMSNYLKKNPATGSTSAGLIPLCDEVNHWPLAQNLETPTIPDPNADITDRSGFDPEPLARGYKVQVVNMRTLAFQPTVCGRDINQISLQPDETFLVSAKVAWGLNRKNEIVMSTIVPGPVVPPLPADPCDPMNPSGVINFEQLPNGSTPTEQLAISTQYLGSRGLVFSLEGSGTPTIAQRGNQGTNGYAFICEACGNLSEGFVPSDPGMGDYFLTTKDDGTGPKTLIVTYQQPVAQLSFKLADIDDGEGWDVQARGSAGEILQTISIPASTSMVNDGRTQRFSFNRATNDIHSLRFRPSGTKSSFGLALDEFSPRAICGAAAPLADLKINGMDGPLSVPSGSNLTLSWTSSNADSCTLRRGSTVISNLANSSMTVNNVTANATYTLTCLKAGLQNAEDIELVQIYAPPVACGAGYGAPPPPLAATTWKTFTENFATDPNVNPTKWKLNRMRSNWGNTTRQNQYTCKPGTGEFYMVQPPGGSGTNETGFSCQALVVAKDAGTNTDFVVGPEWNASYEFAIQQADDCADSINFVWNADDWNPSNTVGLVDHVWWAPNIFYAFEADVYRNGNWGNGTVDPDDHHFSVIRGIAHPPLPNTTYSGISNLCDNRWRRIELEYRHKTDLGGAYLADQSGTFKVKVDGTQVIDTTLRCVDYARNKFAIHGVSGADTAHIRVRNIRIDSRY